MIYTVWVCAANGEGTHHISSHEAMNADHAAGRALLETTKDWSCEMDDLHVLGIAKGDVEIVEWNEEEVFG